MGQQGPGQSSNPIRPVDRRGHLLFAGSSRSGTPGPTAPTSPPTPSRRGQTGRVHSFRNHRRRPQFVEPAWTCASADNHGRVSGPDGLRMLRHGNGRRHHHHRGHRHAGTATLSASPTLLVAGERYTLAYNGNGDLTCSEAEEGDEGLKLPARGYHPRIREVRQRPLSSRRIPYNR